jgi:hypothetical protein
MARGPKYPPRFPRAFTKPIAEPVADRGSVSVGIAQKGPNAPKDPAPTREMARKERTGKGRVNRTLASMRTPPHAMANATCQRRSRLWSEWRETMIIPRAVKM